MTKRFIDKSNLRVDIHHNTTYESTVANRWLATRLQFLGYSIVFIDALFIVLTRESISPGVAELTLSYAMKIKGTLNQLMTASTTLETDIVSVERCVEYTQTPTEVRLNKLNFYYSKSITRNTDSIFYGMAKDAQLI
jgi:ATP-binding cassette subfamily C (CFTR/MRP) protein 1